MSALRKSDEDIVRLNSGDDLRSYMDTLSGHGPQHESVVEVDRDDDLTSLRSKLESTRLPRAVLILPSNAKALKDGLEFRVLRRLQRELGLDIIIVSSDLNRRGFARENGFRSVYSSLRAYYTSKTPPPDRSKSVPFTDPEEFSPSLGVSRWGILIGLLLTALLAAVAYLTVPVATVVIYPETQSLVRNVEVLVEIGGPNLDVTAQRLSGRFIEERVQVSDNIEVKAVQPPPRPDPAATPVPGLPVGFSVTLEVRDALRQQMLEQATAQAPAQLKGQLKSNESMPEQSIRTMILSERYDRNIGDTAESLGGSIEVSTAGLAFSNEDFNKLVLILWSQDVPRDFKAVAPPKVDPPAVVSTEGQHMTLRVRVSGTLQRNVNTDSVASSVRGKTEEEARRSLSAISGLTRPSDLTLWPSWIGRAYRVQVMTDTESTPPQ